jgi:hypothetical protein
LPQSEKYNMLKPVKGIEGLIKRNNSEEMFSEDSVQQRIFEKYASELPTLRNIFGFKISL